MRNKLNGILGFAIYMTSAAMLLPNAAGQETSGPASEKILTGQNALGAASSDAPGVKREITVKDLPAPFATKSVDKGAKVVARGESMPKVPAGFTVSLFATGLKNPREIRTAPNGDLFVAESQANQIHVLRDKNLDGKPEINAVFVGGLNKPFGIAFYPPGPDPQYIYVANTDSVVRFPYKNGDTSTSATPEKLADLSGGGHLRGGGHWTRDIVFSKDGKKMYVSVGSKSNNSDTPAEDRRARIFEYTPDGKNERVYAYGIRNPVGLAINPETGQLWTSVNERDELGDFLPPDYITHVEDGGFYGWPWFYIGGHQDPKHAGKHPELKDKVIVPDLLVQAHSASLEMAFYTGKQFPPDYMDSAFACFHGSWNRNHRTGYKVVNVPMKDGKAVGDYMDFMTGFVNPDGSVWGRPVGVTMGNDGSLFVTDDGSNSVWKVSYSGANGSSGK